MNTYPKPGNAAPHFRAPATGGHVPSGDLVGLEDFQGKPLILYFYPKDDTPGCTRQACGLRDAWSQLQSKAHILGVSPDPISKHEKFIKKYELPFTILSDEDHSVAEAYGVWVEKSMYGKKYMGMERTTFVISPEGTILAVFPKVKPELHLEQVLGVL